MAIIKATPPSAAANRIYGPIKANIVAKDFKNTPFLIASTAANIIVFAVNLSRPSARIRSAIVVAASIGMPANSAIFFAPSSTVSFSVAIYTARIAISLLFKAGIDAQVEALAES